MNDSCTPLVVDAPPRQERNLLETIIEKFTPDNSAQELELCRGRAKTPHAELVAYRNDLTGGGFAALGAARMHLGDSGYTAYDTNASGHERLLFRSNKDSAFNTKSESAYKYDDQGKLTVVLEHSSSPKFETIRKTSLTASGWQEERWNRYGTQFNKMPTITGQTEFKGQADGSVLRVTRTADTSLGAAPIFRPTIELHTVYDLKGGSMTLKRL